MSNRIIALFRRRDQGSQKGDAKSATVGIKRNMPLVPADSIAGRALVTVIAIMTFLAAFVTGLGLLFNNASSEWADSIAREMTIQVRPIPNRDIEADVRSAVQIAYSINGVLSTRVFGKGESQRLLEPWLGTGLDLDELPIPRLIVLKFSRDKEFDSSALREKLRTTLPVATLDDHSVWIERLASMAKILALVIATFVILVLIAMALAVAFATRGAMAGNKGIIDVLHFVGAADEFIAREFQRHFLKLGLRGGAIGVAMTLSVFLAFKTFAVMRGSDAETSQLESFFGVFVLGFYGYFAIVSVGFGVALLTALVSRIIVVRHLNTVN